MIISNLGILKSTIQEHISKRQSIIWTNGCFDILHPWHIEVFKFCRSIGDVVVVWINSDSSSYWESKPGRPINNISFRSNMLEAIKYIDYIYIYNDKDPANIVKEIRPTIIVKWWDYLINWYEWLIRDKWSYLDLTDAYNFIVHSWNSAGVLNKSYMPEAISCVENWWKVYIFKAIEWLSSTNVINKIISVYGK